MTRQSGFTLVELMVTLMVLEVGLATLLAAIARVAAQGDRLQTSLQAQYDAEAAWLINAALGSPSSN